MLEQKALASRRLNSRIQITESVWVYWYCNERAEVSRLRNLSLSGVFLETPKSYAVGTMAQIHFLVREGQIRTEGVIRHLQPGHGLGFRFIAVKDEDRPRLISFVNRLRMSQNAP
jgi:hypothetical protein